MKTQALVGVVVLAGSVGLASTPAWSDGGYHADSATGRDSFAQRSDWNPPADSFAMDSYDREGLAEFRQEHRKALTGAQEGSGGDLTIALGPDSDELDWGPIESKDDRDFHS